MEREGEESGGEELGRNVAGGKGVGGRVRRGTSGEPCGARVLRGEGLSCLQRCCCLEMPKVLAGVPMNCGEPHRDICLAATTGASATVLMIPGYTSVTATRELRRTR